MERNGSELDNQLPVIPSESEGSGGGVGDRTNARSEFGNVSFRASEASRGIPFACAVVARFRGSLDSLRSARDDTHFRSRQIPRFARNDKFVQTRARTSNGFVRRRLAVRRRG